TGSNRSAAAPVHPCPRPLRGSLDRPCRFLLCRATVPPPLFSGPMADSEDRRSAGHGIDRRGAAARSTGTGDALELGDQVLFDVDREAEAELRAATRASHAVDAAAHGID